MNADAADDPSVAIVIVNYRTPALAIRCLEALAGERAALPGLHVVLMDGGSADGSAEVLAEAVAEARFAGWVRLLALPINGGFGWANNQAMLTLLQSAAPPDFIHLLNPDTVIEPGAVAALARELAAHPRCAAVGSLLIEPDGAPSGSAFRFPSAGRELLRGSRTALIGRLLGIADTLVESSGASRTAIYLPSLQGREGTEGWVHTARGRPQVESTHPHPHPLPAPQGGELPQPSIEVDWVTGASVMLRAEALRSVGLFDDGFFLYFEEVDLMHRMTRAGWTIRHQPQSRVMHVGGAATGVNETDQRVGRPGLRPRRPGYWYASRRRCLALSGKGVFAANVAWLAGHALWTLRRLCGLARSGDAVAHEARDLIAAGLLATRADRTPAIVRTEDPPGMPPAWMRR